MQTKNLKSEVFRFLRRIDLRTKYRNLQNFVTNVEVEKRPLNLTGKSCVVISPHPDDESIACGGTVKLLTQSGNRVDVVYLTAGEYGVGPQVAWTPEIGEALKNTRRREAADACDILGVHENTFLSGNDSQLHLQGDLSRPLADHLNRGRYDLLFCPWPYDAHSDHAAAFQIVKRALARVENAPEIWMYEVWNPLLANRLVAIDGTLDTKLRAIASHQSQKAVSDFSRKFIALAEYRSVAIPGARYAEAFFVCDASFLSKMK